MRMMVKQMWLGIVLMAIVLLQADAGAQNTAAPASPANQSREMVAGMEITIAPDGSVTRVLPATTLPEPVRQLLVKRVSQWRYEIPLWNGKPAQVDSYLILTLLAVPTTTGGFVLRVSKLGGEWDLQSGFGPGVPVYPESAMRREIGGVFAYALRLRPDGNVETVRRIYPEKASDPIRKAIDESAQRGLSRSRFRPHVVGGVAVTCEIALPITFTPPDANGLSKEKIPDGMLDAALRTPCPKLALETKIENTML